MTKKALFLSTDPFEDVDDILAIEWLFNQKEMLKQYDSIIIATSNIVTICCCME